ncbi:hypothetical protein ACP4OV_020452 [Aristida adscensionis]
MPSSTPSSVQLAPSLQPLPSSAAGQGTRIDVREIKSMIVNRIGPERTKKYFQHLEGFLSSCLSKNEFDKLCLVALGRENLPLHNHLIRSILHNASRSCGPPIINDPKLVRDITSSGHALVRPVWEDDGGLNQNVKENRPLNKRENIIQKSSLDHHEIRANGVHNLGDPKRCAQSQQSEHVEPLLKRMRVEKQPFNLHESLHSSSPSGMTSRENLGQEIIYQSQGPVQVPLGIQLRPASFGRAQKPLTCDSITSNDTFDACLELGELCDTSSVKKRMEKIAEAEGLEAVSMECADLLNNGLDVFMKQLIGSCLELVKARSQHGKQRHEALKQLLSRKLINGVSLPNHIPGLSGIIPSETNSISMQELKTVIKLSPHLLRVNTSLVLEKINSCD